MVGAQDLQTENMERLEKMQLAPLKPDVTGEPLNGTDVVKNVEVEGAEEFEDSTEGPLAGEH